MGCLGELMWTVEDIISDVMAFQRAYDQGHSDDLTKGSSLHWYHLEYRS